MTIRHLPRYQRAVAGGAEVLDRDRVAVEPAEATGAAALFSKAT